MPELTTRERAEDFVRELLEDQNASFDTFYLWADKLTEIMERAEGEAESKGREEMIDSAQENVMLNLQVKHLLSVLEAARERQDCKNCGGQGATPSSVSGNVDFDLCDCWSRLQTALEAYAKFEKDANLT